MAQTLLLTGASSGIGKATALLFAEKGWTVVATMRTPGKAGDWAKRPDVHLLPLDVTDPESIRAAVAETVRRFGGDRRPRQQRGLRDGRRVRGLHLEPGPPAVRHERLRPDGPHAGGPPPHARAAEGDRRQRRLHGGRITFPLYSVYHATKWAVEGFSEALNYEMEPFGVTVKIVEPGPIRTDFYDRSMDLVTKVGLTAYDSFAAKAMPNMQKAGATAPGPEVVAKVIWSASTDGSRRIRYQANSAPILALRRLLPDRLFMAVVKAAVLR